PTPAPIFRSRPRPALQCKSALHRRSALTHSDQTEVRSIIARRRIYLETDAIIIDTQLYRLRIKLKLDLNVAGRRMPNGVADRLAADSQQVIRNITGDGLQFAEYLASRVNRRVFCQPLDRFVNDTRQVLDVPRLPAQ